MKPSGASRTREPASIRLRLGLALAVALLPVLLLSAVQAGLEFRHEIRAQRSALIDAALRSGASARARIESAQVLLQTLGPGSVGLECAQRLAEVAARIPGYENLMRFDAFGRVACSAASTPADPGRAGRPWFVQLSQGAPVVISLAPGAAYASQPSVLAASPVRDDAGHVVGALAAVLSLESLRPDAAGASLPSGSQVAVTDKQGHLLSATDISVFPTDVGGRLARARPGASLLWSQNDRRGARRLFAAAPLVGDQMFVLLSAPTEGLVSWAWLNPVSAVALPVLAFSLSLLTVLFVAEREVVRWIAYLRRIAVLYTRGRYTVRPVRAERAPPEIHDLADTLSAMADAIAARDEELTRHLAQKDAMLREIHHRVKNNLQVISSLLNLQQRTLNDPAARAAVSDTRQRIAALALVYRALYQSPDMRKVDLRDFLEELIGQLVMSEAGQMVRTDLACDPLVMDPDLLAPLALFAVEAISNARKHGLAEGGRLGVSFVVSGEKAELVISDTGVPGRVSRVGPGVGRTLMTAFARQLRGEVKFETAAGGGLRTSLVFPTPAYTPLPMASDEVVGIVATSAALSPSAAH